MSLEDAIKERPTVIDSNKAQYSPIRSEAISKEGAAIQIASAATTQERYLNRIAQGSMTIRP